jgi:hypothetical protein
MDILYLGIVIAFFALSWGLTRACELLGGQEKGDR